MPKKTDEQGTKDAWMLLEAIKEQDGIDVSPFLKWILSKAALDYNEAAWGGKSLAKNGLAKFFDPSLVSGNEPFPIQNPRFEEVGPEFKALVESLGAGGSKEFPVDTSAKDPTGVRRAKVPGGWQEWVRPDGLDMSMFGQIDEATGFSPGRFNVQVGKDESGKPYVEMSDIYDFHRDSVDSLGLPFFKETQKQAVDMLNALGKPYQYSSRFYFDPITYEFLKP